MPDIAYFLDGLAEYLEVERELGERRVECDVRLLDALAADETGGERVGEGGERVGGENRRTEKRQPPAANHQPPPAPLPFLFLHDRPLSELGAEMVAKIVAALKVEGETPVVTERPVPPAKLYVILGGNALKRFLPGVHAEPGQWVKTAAGRDALVTYSPEYLLRFATVTPAVDRMKRAMWLSLKGVKQRLT